jgi:hypothetical protein
MPNPDMGRGTTCHGARFNMYPFQPCTTVLVPHDDAVAPHNPRIEFQEVLGPVSRISYSIRRSAKVMAIQFVWLMNLLELKETDGVLWGQLAPRSQIIRECASGAMSPLLSLIRCPLNVHGRTRGPECRFSLTNTGSINAAFRIAHLLC